PPNALAGRRLQPLGHFSGGAQDIGRSGGVREPRGDPRAVERKRLASPGLLVGPPRRGSHRLGKDPFRIDDGRPWLADRDRPGVLVGFALLLRSSISFEDAGTNLERLEPLVLPPEA